jgi:hypothetical protein
VSALETWSAPASSRAAWAEGEAGREAEAPHPCVETAVHVTMSVSHDYLQSVVDS